MLLPLYEEFMIENCICSEVECSCCIIYGTLYNTRK